MNSRGSPQQRKSWMITLFQLAILIICVKWMLESSNGSEAVAAVLGSLSGLIARL